MKRRVTAGELMKRLNADPAFVARRARQDEELAVHQAEYRRVEAPLVKDLREAGYEVDSVWDLVNTSASYARALPILLEHLERPYPAPVREGIARALAVPEARFAFPTLVRLFRSADEKGVSDGLACAIAAAADDSVIDEVIELVRDPHQTSRVLMLSALARSRDPRAQATLMELGADSVLGTEAQRILRKRKRRPKTRK